jgi:hypothetical protein
VLILQREGFFFRWWTSRRYDYCTMTADSRRRSAHMSAEPSSSLGLLESNLGGPFKHIIAPSFANLESGITEPQVVAA